ncbi:MAG TPA: 2-oxoacid:acceptor oxidoreductase family protein [Streptosporangiaceae bacterium]|nr:2-oxoacid:acceptor oxidoreductase family protein [Streptosporangiaceae bacterium]
MFEIRFYGRGGQGTVTAAELLSAAAFTEGRHAQAFPSFGSERTGAPVMSFCRLDDKPIRSREPVTRPDALVIQDPTLLHQVNVFEGARADCRLLINSARPAADLNIGEFTSKLPPGAVLTVPATEFALKHLGRPVPSAALLGGFAALTGLVTLESVTAAIEARFAARPQVAAGNVGAARAAFDYVTAELARLGLPSGRAARNGGRPAPSAAEPPVPSTTAVGTAGTGTAGTGTAGGSGGGRVAQIEGSAGVAEAVARCRPEVICAYPISPQTHIVEALSRQVKSGQLAPCEFINVESEFAAMSVAIGASAAGARAYTATASQGLLYMTEPLYNASGLGLPIVMTVANRAIGAPINIWNDHSDAMSQRDCGWIQLYAETNQEAMDLHIQAFRLAEALPVMVCMDGFILTHAHERLEVPGAEQVDAFLPPFEPRQVLDPGEPVSIGAMVGPEAFTEVRFLAHARQLQALDLIPRVAAEFAERFGRNGAGHHGAGLVRPYRTEDAQTIVVALGSVLGTIKDTVDELRDDGMKIGALGITSFRPFPLDAVAEALGNCRRVVVVEKALAVGIGGIVSANVRMALSGVNVRDYTVIAGLGGRAITRKSLRELFLTAARDQLEPLTFLDLDVELVGRELARVAASRQSGPAAENMLRDLGAVASRIG